MKQTVDRLLVTLDADAWYPEDRIQRKSGKQQ